MGTMTKIKKPKNLKLSSSHCFFVGKNGEVHREYNQICYGVLYRITVKPKELGIFISDKAFSGEEYKRKYLTWLMNESIFAPIYLTKDFDEGMENGIRFDVNYNFTSIFCAMTLARELFMQDTFNPDIFNACGEDNLMRLVMSQTIRVDKERERIEVWQTDHNFMGGAAQLDYFDKPFIPALGKSPVSEVGFHAPNLWRLFNQEPYKKHLGRKRDIYKDFGVARKGCWGNTIHTIPLDEDVANQIAARFIENGHL